jgi:hypothetical protein
VRDYEGSVKVSESAPADRDRIYERGLIGGEPAGRLALAGLAIAAASPQRAMADEGGVSFWLPGSYEVSKFRECVADDAVLLNRSASLFGISGAPPGFRPLGFRGHLFQYFKILHQEVG